MARVIAITGGSGYVGFRLATRLVQDDASISVRLLDLRAPKEALPDRVVFDNVNLLNVDALRKSLTGVQTVFHMASFGMSGKEMLQLAMIRRVNIEGTNNVISLCKEVGVKSLVYVSSYNAVFAGNTIVNGNMRQPYLKPEQHVDEYSRTKALAEVAVLGANSLSLATTAIRPAAIYGDGEERHFPRILTYFRDAPHMALFGIGSKETLCDWVYVDNLVEALSLAYMCLAKEGQQAVCGGNAYCISDGAPVNNFVFLKEVAVGLGYDPRFVFVCNLPTSMMTAIAVMGEFLHKVLRKVFIPFQPFLTRAEVHKVGVTHYFSMDDAKRDLGYKPVVSPQEALRRTIEYYKRDYSPRPSVFPWQLISLLLLFCTLFLFFVLS